MMVFSERALTKPADPVATFDYVIRRLNALSAGFRKLVETALTVAEAPLSAISRFTWSLEASVRPVSLTKMVLRSARIWTNQ